MSSPSRGPLNERAERLAAEIAVRGSVPCAIGGRSMEPTLALGEVVMVEQVSRPQRGDVVVAEIAGALAVHRLVVCGPGGVTCRGDACIHRDPLVPYDAVVGQVRRTQDGRHIAGGRGTLMMVRARFLLRLLPIAFCLIRAEMDLAWRQARRLPLPPPDLAGLAPNDCVDARCDDRMVIDGATAARLLSLRRADAGHDRVLSAIPMGHTIEVPAGIYGALDADMRLTLLSALSGRHVLVWGWHWRGRRTSVTADARRVLAARGVPIGKPGDGIVCVPNGGWRYRHQFTDSELVGELRHAGGANLVVSTIDTFDGLYVRCEADMR